MTATCPTCGHPRPETRTCERCGCQQRGCPVCGRRWAIPPGGGCGFVGCWECHPGTPEAEAALKEAAARYSAPARRAAAALWDADGAHDGRRSGSSWSASPDRLAETEARIEAERRRRASAPIAVGDLVRVRSSWALGIVQEIAATWHGTKWLVAVEAGRNQTATVWYGRDGIVPEEEG